MRVRWNVVKALGSITVPIIVVFALAGWVEQQSRSQVGDRASAPAIATATATLAAYPLPGQRTNPATAKATVTPTRLAAYPMPGAATPTPAPSKQMPGPLTAQTGTLTYTLFLPIIRNDCLCRI